MQEWQKIIIEKDAMRLDFPTKCTCENSDWFIQIDKKQKTNDFFVALKILDDKYEDIH